MEGFQAGLSWKTILHRREYFRQAFFEFHIPTVAKFNDSDVKRLVNDKGIIRNRRKIQSAINNAKMAQKLQIEYGSLSRFFWSFEPKTKNRPEKITRAWLKENPISQESTRLSKELKTKGWTFVGPTSIYALMQALGIVNDHVHTCPAKRRVDAAKSKLKTIDTIHV